MGVKTGFNEAFIISGEKRKELIKQDPKSAEIIKPVLRGKDIKRYGYDFVELYLITTFPSLKININKYPAVKKHLLSFGYDKLKQTGEPGARKKTNNKWFETQDSIAYWNDFLKPKIMWSDISTEPSFVYVDKEMFLNSAGYIMTNAPIYVLGILNSKIIEWYFPKISTDLGGGSRYVNKFVELLPILESNAKTGEQIEKLIKAKDYEAINKLVYKLYGLTEEEIEFIKKQ